MKKILLASLVIGLSIFRINAQISITSSDVISPAKVVYQANDALPSGSLSVGSAGANKVWNMGMLNTSTIDTLNYIPFSWAPNAKFSTANLVQNSQTGSSFSYLNNSTSELTFIGNVFEHQTNMGPVPVEEFYTPAEKLMKFPMTYLSTFSDIINIETPAYSYDPPFIDSMKVQELKKKTVTVDAWGSLTTPLGTFDVLRIKETAVSHDTSSQYFFGSWITKIKSDSTTTYTWVANNIGVALVTIAVDSFGAIKKPVKWLKSMPTVGINELSASSPIDVYPNPSQNEVNFKLDPKKISLIEIFDITGRILKTISVSTDVSLVNTTDFKNGIYLFNLLSKDNNVQTRGKFTVAK